MFGGVSRSLALVACALVCVSAPAPAQDRRDQQFLSQFDANYAQLAAARDRGQLGSLNRGQLQQMLQMLDMTLNRVSDAGKQTQGWKDRKQKLDDMTQAALGAAAPKPQPTGPDPKKLTDDEATQLQKFDQRIMQDWAEQDWRLKQIGRTKAQATIDEGTAMLDALRPELAEHKEVQKRRQRLEAMRTLLAQTFAVGPFSQPRPEAQAGDTPLPEGARAVQAEFDAYLAAHGPALEAPAAQDEVELRCHVYELERLLGLVQRAAGTPAGGGRGRGRGAPAAPAGAGSHLELRLNAWHVARFAHGLEAKFGAPEGEASQRDHDRMSSMQRELSERIWTHTGDPLYWQDPQAVQDMRATLATYRQELDGMAAKYPRLSSRFQTEYEYRRAVARLSKETGAATKLGEQAGDVGAQLKLWQETFPKDAFDPSFKGTLTEAALRDWGKQMRNWRDGVEPALAFFERAQQFSVEAREAAFLNYVAWFRFRVKDSITDAIRRALTPLGEDLGAGRRASEQRIDDGTTAEFKERLFGSLTKGEAAARLLIAFHEGWQDTTFGGSLSLEKLEKDLATISVGREKFAAETKRLLEERRLPDPVQVDGRLLSLAKERLEGRFGQPRVRGLRVTLPPESYEHREVQGDFIVITWWESYRVDFALQKEGSDRWYHEDYRVVRRLNRGRQPIGEWSVSNHRPSYSLEILPQNVPD